VLERVIQNGLSEKYVLVAKKWLSREIYCSKYLFVQCSHYLGVVLYIASLAVQKQEWKRA
jgi:hypothetical protein